MFFFPCLLPSPLPNLFLSFHAMLITSHIHISSRPSPVSCAAACPSGLLGFLKSCWLSMMASRLHFVVTPRPILQNRGHAAHKRQILSSSVTITLWRGFSLQQITPRPLFLSVCLMSHLFLSLSVQNVLSPQPVKLVML